MIGEDSLITIVFGLIVVGLVLNMHLGVPFEALVWPFSGSISEKLIGVNLHGIDTLLLLTLVIGGFKGIWRDYGTGIVFLFFLAFVYLITW